MQVKSAELERVVGHGGSLPVDDRPQICFVGRSNVGKSSLLNRLLGKKGLAHVGSTPGRTRSINYYLINDAIYFVDLPGFGYAKASKLERNQWAELIDEYFAGQSERLLVVQLVDAKVGATELDLQAYEYVAAHGFQPLVVATKIDKLGRSRRFGALAEIRNRLNLTDDGIIPFSAVKGEGLRALWSAIDLALEGRLGVTT